MEKNSIRKKSRSGAILSLVGFVMMMIVFVYLFYDLSVKNQELDVKNQELDVKNEELEESNQTLIQERDDCSFLAKKLQDSLAVGNIEADSPLVIENDSGAWQITQMSNTLEAYNSYAKLHGDKNEEINKAIEQLLNREGYVQIIEINGNQLFKPEKMSLEGEYLIAKTARAVRTGIIKKDSNPPRSGVLVAGQIVKIVERIPSDYSASVWGKIKYRN